MKKSEEKPEKSISSVMLWTITKDTLRCYTLFHPPDTLQTDRVAETHSYVIRSVMLSLGTKCLYFS